MIRNLKVLGLALVAVFAMSAVAASAASAANFMSEAASTRLEGTQKTTNVFTIESGQTECTVANFAGTATGTEFSEVTVTPTYSGCTTFGIESDVNMNGCKYKLTSATPVSGQAEVHVEGCNTGKHIELTVTVEGSTFCTVTVFPGTYGHVTYRNTGSGSTADVDLVATVGGITYEVDGGGGLCGEEGVLKHDGTYEGEVTIKGFNTSGGAQVGISHTPATE